MVLSCLTNQRSTVDLEINPRRCNVDGWWYHLAIILCHIEGCHICATLGIATFVPPWGLPRLCHIGHGHMCQIEDCHNCATCNNLPQLCHMWQPAGCHICATYGISTFVPHVTTCHSCGRFEIATFVPHWGLPQLCHIGDCHNCGRLDIATFVPHVATCHN